MPDERFIHRKSGHGRRSNLLNDLEFRIWIQYLLSADDFGVMRFSAATLQDHNDHLHNRPARQVLKCFAAVVKVGLLDTFEHQGRSYVYQYDWQDWQKIRYPRATLHPCPPAESLEKCTKPTRRLFAMWPGGDRTKNSREADAQPSDNSRTSDAQLTDDNTTRAGVPAKRLTANGKRLTADLSEERLDLAFVRFQDAYPANRRVGGYRAQTAFVDAAAKATVAAVFAALENHKASAQWASPKLIPSMDRWLADELWRQELPATEVARSPGDAWRPEGQ